jgi:tetratricopeptide (TPR) repeat protein
MDRLSLPIKGLVLVILGLLIYAQTFRFDFVFDDYIFVVTNPFIKNFSNFHLMWHAFPMTRFVGMYSFALNYSVSHFHPAGFHVFNFIVHLISTGLVWALATLLFKITCRLPSDERRTRHLPFVIAALFLVHPCQTQAVSYVTQRFESMAAMFYLGAVYAYLRGRVAARTAGKVAFFTLSGMSAALGILTKEVAATIPLMILVSEWILFPRKYGKKFYIVLAAGGILFYLLFSRLVHDNLRIFWQSIPSESHDGDILTPARYLLTQMRVLLTFLRILVWPANQNLDYDYPASTGLFHPPLTMAGMGVAAAMVWLVVRLRRKFPLISWGAAWVLITFSINLAPRSNVIFEHKLYLISFGFFLAAVAALLVLVQNHWTLIKIFSCMILVLSLASFQRNKIWSNELTLWEDNIKKSPRKARVNASLGRVYGTLGRYPEAIDYLSRAIALKPEVITYENRGVIYSLQGRMTEALADFNRSLAMEPDYFLTYTKRAWVYGVQHDYNAAMADLNHAIWLDPYFADTYVERGMIWMASGHQQEALKDFEEVLKLDPFNYDVLLKAGYIYYTMGRFDLALKVFTKAQGLEPASPEAAKYRSYCLERLGQPKP